MSHAVLLIALLLAGCNLFGQPPDVDDAGVSAMDAAATDDIGPVDPPDGGVADLQPSDAGADAADSDRDDASSMDMTGDLADTAVGDMAVDAGDDMGASDPCSWPDTLFCSGFEDPTFGDWDGTDTDMCGLTHETTVVHNGSGALKTDMLQGGGRCVVYARGLSPPIDNGEEVWMRAWLYLPSDLTLDYFEWVGLRSLVSGEGAFAAIHNSGIDGHFHFDAYDGEPNSSYSMPRDQWLCVEWNIQLDAQAGRSLVSVDGVSRVDVGALPLTVVEPLDGFDVGQVYARLIQSGVVYFDDVFIGRSRPGCD